MSAPVSIFDDLVAEYDRLEGLLADLDDEAWRSPSAAAGWSIADVVLHLAQTEEAVVATISQSAPQRDWHPAGMTLDAAVDELVRAERAEPAVVFERWRSARRASVDALRAADPDVAVGWAATPIKPRTLATTRIAEHWAHGLDITDPLGLPFPDTDRLRHIAWLGHSTLPYAYAFEGREPHVVHAELTSPSGDDVWRFGPEGADSCITGPVGDFCRVGAKRLAPADARLTTTGPHARGALEVLRNYAG
jgi:uncharacterized protein (TIGR03084 family)